MRTIRNIILIMILAYTAVYAEPARNLSWEKVEGAAGYYLEIKDSGDTVVVSQTINSNSYDISKLQPGKYSFRIATVNILNQRGESTRWIDFSVEKLFIPKLKNASRKELIASSVNRNIIIRGSNFKSQSRFVLRGNGIEVELEDVDVISESEAEINFKPSSSQKGVYDLAVINRGGVESVLKNAFTIVEAENAEIPFYIGGAYSVNMPAGGFSDYVAMSYIGASAFLQVSALKFGYDNLFFDFEIDAARYANTADSKKCSLTYATMGFGTAYVYPVLNARVDLVFRFLTGPAYTILTLDEKLSDKEETSIDWFGMLGAGVRYFPGENIFIEPSFNLKTVFYTGTFFYDARVSFACGTRL